MAEKRKTRVSAWVSAGCRQGVGEVSANARITDLGPNVLGLPQKADTWPIPLRPLADGGGVAAVRQ